MGFVSSFSLVHYHELALFDVHGRLFGYKASSAPGLGLQSHDTIKEAYEKWDFEDMKT
jgi:hypothetical protein